MTVTVDRDKADEARALAGAPSISAVIDVALDRLIKAERPRRDIAAYQAVPPDGAIAAVRPDNSDLADDADWAALYGVS